MRCSTSKSPLPRWHSWEASCGGAKPTASSLSTAVRLSIDALDIECTLWGRIFSGTQSVQQLAGEGGGGTSQRNKRKILAIESLDYTQQQECERGGDPMLTPQHDLISMSAHIYTHISEQLYNRIKQYFVRFPEALAPAPKRLIAN